MALKQATKDTLKARGLDVEKLIAAVTAEGEVDYEVTEGTFLTPTDLTARDSNMKEAGKKEAEPEGEKKGKELAAKILKKKFGIEDPEKDLDKVADLVNTKVGKGDEGLREQNALLIKDKEKLTSDLAAERAKAEAAAQDSNLISWFPSNRGDEMSDAERLALTKMAIQFETVDGKLVCKRNGEVLRDPTTQNPLEPKKVIADYFSERRWTGTSKPGGRGGNDNPPGPGAGGNKKLSDVQADWLKQNPGGNVISPEFDQYLTTVTKDVPDFDFDA